MNTLMSAKGIRTRRWSTNNGTQCTQEQGCQRARQKIPKRMRLSGYKRFSSYQGECLTFLYENRTRKQILYAKCGTLQDLNAIMQGNKCGMVSNSPICSTQTMHMQCIFAVMVFLQHWTTTAFKSYISQYWYMYNTHQLPSVNMANIGTNYYSSFTMASYRFSVWQCNLSAACQSDFATCMCKGEGIV